MTEPTHVAPTETPVADPVTTEPVALPQSKAEDAPKLDAAFTLRSPDVSAKKTYALITGASSGLGAAFARLFAEKQKPLLLVAKDEARVKAFAAELRETYGGDVRFLALDLARSKTLPQLPEKLSRLGITVDVLVNAAGFAKYGSELQIAYEDALNIVNLNCRSLLALTKLFAPGMAQRGKGAIINVAATSAFAAVPYLAAYSASKAFVLHYSEAIAEELRPRGVRVLCVCPGPMETAFSEKAGIPASVASRMGTATDPAVIATQAIDALKKGRRILVPPSARLLERLAPTVVPRKLLASFGVPDLKPPTN